MNRIRLTIMGVVLLVTGFNKVQAQEARGGIKGGLNLSNLYIDDVDDENVRTGFHAGIFTQLMVGQSFAIQPELLYTAKGAKTEYNSNLISGEADFNLNYIEVPLLATIKLGDAADIHIGPYIGYLIGAKMKTEGNFGSSVTELDRDNFNKVDYGLAGGLALNFTVISFGLRYNYGLAEIADGEDAEIYLGDAKNSVAQVYAAFNLN